MKLLGFLLFAIGLALLVFALVNFYRNGQQLKSPIPQDRGVKVIFITPSK